MWRAFLRLIKGKRTTKAARVLPAKTGCYDSPMALFSARLSQLAYPGGCCENQDYQSQEEFLEDMQKKKEQAAHWGIKKFDYIYSRDGQILVLLFRKGRDVMISFRGTVINNFNNLNMDIKTRLVPFNNFGKVHEGFKQGLEWIWPELHAHPFLDKKRRTWLTGHSMGGALAVLAGVRFFISNRGTEPSPVKGIYVFAAPRAGDADFESAFRRTSLEDCCYCFARYNDMVTVVPPNITRLSEYTHVGRIIYMDPLGKLVPREHLNALETWKEFLSGYFREHLLGRLNWETVVGDWKTFFQFFGKVFSELKLKRSTGKSEKRQYKKFKKYFDRNVSPTGGNEATGAQGKDEIEPAVFKIVIDLFIETFMELNPYAVESHSIASYIDTLEKNLEVDPFQLEEKE